MLLKIFDDHELRVFRDRLALQEPAPDFGASTFDEFSVTKIGKSSAALLAWCWQADTARQGNESRIGMKTLEFRPNVHEDQPAFAILARLL
jgi:hypothetical protein